MELNEILAFNQLVLNKSEAEKIELAKKIGIDYAEYKQRIIGKEKEAEFVIILKSLGCLKHIEAFDEGLSHLTNEYTPDYSIELIDGYKFLLEVKHTDKDSFKISMGNLNKRKEFADRHNEPLRFAISIKGFWGLFTAEDLLEKKGKLEISDFGGEKSISWLDIELATCSYMFSGEIKIKSVYQKNANKGLGIYYNQYGELVSYELYYRDKRLFRVKGVNSSYKAYSFYLEALQNRLANVNQEIKQSGETTVIIESLNNADNACVIPEYEFLLAPIKHMVSELKSEQVGYNAMRAVADKGFKYLDIGILRMCMSELSEWGLDIIVFRNSNGYPFEDYKKMYWKNG